MVNWRGRASSRETEGTRAHGEVGQNFPRAWGAVVPWGASNRCRFANWLVFVSLPWCTLTRIIFCVSLDKKKSGRH